jgi:glycosyltransferase involved in cell wall biosynthesis
VVLFFGGWVRYKGIDLLLDAFERIRREVPAARLILAGAVGADIDLAAVATRAESIGGVELIPRYIPIEEVGSLMGRARVIATPYLAANQSGVVHLAHTFGRPVVATDVGDLGQVVRTDETGILVPPGNVHALAEGLVRFLDRPQYADKIGARARREIEASASWDVVARRLTEIYRDLLQARARRAQYRT